ncbi:BICD family-like cargo adapter 2 [Carcharodon carcharias]|uniref:BICD family-like cargo adapter 2 n=1 Tax=Carcharodon carcharias TaxID=13397 RepID=UPI001B7DB9EF|nr:BICD family-like cargo adapter 2 [Carcharodon carcharias]
MERGRIERESLSRQLLQTIEQKISLAQELEEWQEDMQVIISQQLKSQHLQEEAGGKARCPPVPQDGSSFFFRFRKS